MALTRSVADTRPNPPRAPAVPSTGLPPLTIMPASGWNALVASTIVLQAACAWGLAFWHCGSCAATGRATAASNTSEVMYACMVPPLPFRESHAGLPRVHFTNQPGGDLGAVRGLDHRVDVVTRPHGDHADAEIEHPAHLVDRHLAGASQHAKDRRPRPPAGGDDRLASRSEERRVGKEGRSRWSPY